MSAALAGLGCSGDDEADPASFAPRLCAASIGWRDDLAERAEQLSRAGVGVQDPAERTGLLVAYLDDVDGATAAFVAGQAEAAPSTGAARELRAAGEAMAELLRAARQEVVADGDDGPFVPRGISVVNRVEKTASVWKAAVATLRAEDPAFDAGFRATEACQVIPRTADRA